jgi:hypothetical protein
VTTDTVDGVASPVMAAGGVVEPLDGVALLDPPQPASNAVASDALITA